MFNVISKPVMVVIGVIVLFAVGFTAGYNWCNTGKQTAVLDQLEDDREAVQEVKEIIKWREKKVVQYVDKIKLVPADDCTDAPVIPDIDDSLFEAYSTATRSATD